MKDGYYEVVCGQLSEYLPDEILANLQIRADKGTLLAEYGPPRREPYMDDGQWFRRVHEIEMERVCGQYTDIKRGEGNLIVANFKPAGPLKDVVERALATDQSKVMFGMRGFRRLDGTLARLVTYDLVMGPGE